MGDLALRVDGLGKKYRIGKREAAYRTFRDVLADALSAPFKRAAGLLRGNAAAAADLSETIWALRDVSFEVKKGEVVGIIGRNGAGKSTLSKILASITEPSEGEVQLYGRVGALLEVGTGFHPELTGRENIYLNGAILGMSRAEIKRKFDEIVAFAEIEKFIDTPVKHYSSGMGLRLGFAVAAHLEPEILIVDEVLAVGDAAFQKKCLGKMNEVAGEGRTVLFVSHNMAAVQGLCERGIVLERGRLAFDGAVEAALEHYLMQGSLAAQGEVTLMPHSNRRSAATPILQSIRLTDSAGNAKPIFQSGEPLTIELTLAPPQPLNMPSIGIGVDDPSGVRLFSLVNRYAPSGLQIEQIAQPCRVLCQLAELPLLPGRYSLSLSVGTAEEPLMDAIDHAVFLEVEGGDALGIAKLPPAYLGPFLVRAAWQLHQTEAILP
jgi:lipopolysaccharide transport system ATP-binding protein